MRVSMTHVRKRNLDFVACLGKEFGGQKPRCHNAMPRRANSWGQRRLGLTGAGGGDTGNDRLMGVVFGKWTCVWMEVEGAGV